MGASVVSLSCPPANLLEGFIDNFPDIPPLHPVEPAQAGDGPRIADLPERPRCFHPYPGVIVPECVNKGIDCRGIGEPSQRFGCAPPDPFVIVRKPTDEKSEPFPVLRVVPRGWWSRSRSVSALSQGESLRQSRGSCSSRSDTSRPARRTFGSRRTHAGHFLI